MRLQSILDDLFEKDRRVENCVVSIAKGDGSFSWTGAAGIANRSGNLPMTPGTPYCIASITKLFTATAAMQLRDEGKLSLEDPMAGYLPFGLVDGINVYDGADLTREITVEHLLSHSSGIADYYSGKPPGGKSLYAIFLEDPGRKWTVEETVARARDELEAKFAPGTGTSYSDTNFQLMGLVIEEVAGKPLHEVFEERIFRPAGMDGTWLIGRPRRPGAEERISDAYDRDLLVTQVRLNGSYWADGGIVSTAEDCVAFLKALNKGELIRRETLGRMHEWKDLRTPLKYGLGTMYFSLPRQMAGSMDVPPLWGHSGSTGSFLYYSEDLDAYVAGTLNQTASRIKPFSLIGRFLEAVSAGGPDEGTGAG